jgi:hypothetical protein
MALSEAVSADGGDCALRTDAEPGRLLPNLRSAVSNAVCTLGASRQVFRVVFLHSLLAPVTVCEKGDKVMGGTLDGTWLARKVTHLPNLCLVRVPKPKLLKSWNTSFCSMKQHTSQLCTVHALSQGNACAHEVAWKPPNKQISLAWTERKSALPLLHHLCAASACAAAEPCR